MATVGLMTSQQLLHRPSNHHHRPDSPKNNQDIIGTYIELTLSVYETVFLLESQ